MDDEPEGVAVLRAIWTARDHGADVRAEIGSGTGKVCRRLQNVGGPVDDEQRTAWRELLEREGKRGATTVAELVADRDAHRRRDRGPEPRGRRAHRLLREGGYLADRGLATAVHVALALGRPMLLEGEVGVGKTEVAKVLAAVLGRRLIRLQCYEGIDTNQALYEWDYARQMLQIRALSERQLADDGSVDKLFGPEFLLERPLLRRGARRRPGAVLLIDEIDRADDEFEAFLLELLSDFQITIPEIGTIIAPSRRRWSCSPPTAPASCTTRSKRRCLYHWVGYPTAEREVEIVAGPRARRVRGAGPQGRRRGQPAARAGPGQAARRRRDDRLGAHPRRARRERPRRADAADDTLGAVRQGARRPRAGARAPRGDHLRCAERPRRRHASVRARRLRRGAARRGLAVGSGDVADLLRRRGHARPDRPGRPLLGRAARRWSPGATRSRRLRPGVPPVLPRRRSGRSTSCCGSPRSVSAEAESTPRGARPTEPGEEDDEQEASSAWSPPTPRCCGTKSFAACTPEELRGAAPHHRADPADAAAPPHPAHRARRPRAPARPAPDGAGDDAHARRARASCSGAAPACGCGRWS